MGKILSIPPPGARPPAAGREALRRAIADAGVSQEQAAEAGGMSPRHLRRILAGEAPTHSLDVYLAVVTLAANRRRAA